MKHVDWNRRSAFRRDTEIAKNEAFVGTHGAFDCGRRRDAPDRFDVTVHTQRKRQRQQRLQHQDNDYEGFMAQGRVKEGAQGNEILTDRAGFAGPSFTLRNRLMRAVWQLFSVVFFRLSPIPCHRFRVLLLRLWGAEVSMRAHVYPDARIWAPWNLQLADFATIGPRVNCYNVAKVTLGTRAIVSQGAYLCTATHDYDDPDFQLYARPITVQSSAWVCTEAFVGPGVTLQEGAILGARGVANRELGAWAVYSGNPAEFRKLRRRIPAE